MPEDGNYPSNVIPLPADEPVIPILRNRPGEISQADHEPSADTAPLKPRVGISGWVVQVASLSKPDSAEALQNKLRSKGHPAFVEQVSVKGRLLFRVRVGPKASRKDAERISEQIKQQVNLKGQVVRYP